jgi:hypothetical protein
VRAEDILRKRRDRAIAIILGLKEREVDPLLLQEPGGSRASAMMRKVVLDQINDFYDMALDVASSGEAATFEFNPDVWGPRIEGRLADIQRTLVSLGQNGNGAP